MTPLKNTDRCFSDCLPPALVKDWRQCLRSRGYLAIFALLVVVGWVLLAVAAADVNVTAGDYQKALEGLGGTLCFVFAITLCFAIPFRAGMTVAADTRERSSNFLMLTPLTARRIVWGTWSSTALMVLMAALLALPLCFVGEGLRAAYPYCGSFDFAHLSWEAFGFDALTIGALVLGGWVMTAFFMFCAGLPIAVRVILLLFMVGASAELASDVNFIFCAEHKRTLPEFLNLLLGLIDALLLLVLFMELARRHYSAPAENCSRSVRLLAPLPMLLAAIQVGVSALNGRAFGDVDMQVGFAVTFLYLAVFADSLLPSYSLPQMRHRFWPLLPDWFQRPGFVPSVICCTGAVLLSLLPAAAMWAEVTQLLPTSLSSAGDDKMRSVAFYVMESLNVGFTLMLWLLLTDCFCRRNSPRRPLVFGVVALVVSCFFAMLRSVHSDDVLESCMPTMGATISTWKLDELSVNELWDLCGYNGAALLTVVLLLLFWRGFVKKD